MLPASQLIMFTLSTISMLTYALIAVSIHKRRRKDPILKGSFFRLCKINFIIHFAYYLQFNILMRFRKYGLLNFFFEANPNLLVVFPRISLGIHYYAKFVVYTSGVIVAANRLTSAVRPMSYEQIWSNKLMWTVRLFQFAIPLFLIIPMEVEPSREIKYVVYENESTMRMIIDEGISEVYSYIDMASATVTTVISFVMYLITLYKIRRLRSGRALENRQRRSMDYRLLESAFIMFLVFIPNAFVCVLGIVFHSRQNVMLIVNDFSYPVVDLMYCCPPWALLLSSSKIRQCVWRITGKNITRMVSSKPEASTLPNRSSMKRF